MTDIDTASMTQSEREVLPWYGGNKIPDSYLAKFRKEPVQHEGASEELRSFLNSLDGDKAQA